MLIFILSVAILNKVLQNAKGHFSISYGQENMECEKPNEITYKNTAKITNQNTEIKTLKNQIDKQIVALQQKINKLSKHVNTNEKQIKGIVSKSQDAMKQQEEALNDAGGGLGDN